MSAPSTDTYTDRKLQIGRCMRCPRTGLAEEESLCPRCLRRERKRWRDGKRAKRQALRQRGKCAGGCGAKSTTYRCPACAIRDGQTPTVRVTGGVPQDQWRRDGDGWQRFRGRGRKGNPGAAANDELDLSEATKAVERGRAALAYAHSPEVRELGPIQRKAARAAGAAILAMAVRFLEDVIERNEKAEAACPQQGPARSAAIRPRPRGDGR